MENNPKVVIIIPCYNTARYLPEAIECCLAQTYRPIEIVVVDDGSTDQTPAICETYAGRITYIRQENSGSVGAARNTGIRSSQSEYIQFLDADDRILPTKIAEQVEAFRADPELGVVYSDGYLIDGEGERLGPAKINHPSGWVFHELLKMWGTQVAAVLVRRKCIEDVGVFSNDRAIRGVEDLDMWLRLSAKYRFAALPAMHFEYRVGTASMSSNTVMMLRSGLEVLRRHSRVHKHCAECRAAIAAGRKRWKDVAAFGLMGQAREQAKHGDWGGAAAKMMSALWHHPAHLPRVVHPKHLRSKIATLRGDHACD